MDLGDIISIYDKIKERWETKTGFAFTLIIILIIYYFLADYFGLIDLIEYIYISKLFIPIVLLFLAFIFWIYKTNRFFIKSSNKITAGIIIIYDNPDW